MSIFNIFNIKQWNEITFEKLTNNHHDFDYIALIMFRKPSEKFKQLVHCINDEWQISVKIQMI